MKEPADNKIHKYINRFSNGFVITLICDLSGDIPKFTCPTKLSEDFEHIEEYKNWVFSCVFPDLVEKLTLIQLESLTKIGIEEFYK